MKAYDEYFCMRVTGRQSVCAACNREALDGPRGRTIVSRPVIAQAQPEGRRFAGREVVVVGLRLRRSWSLVDGRRLNLGEAHEALVQLAGLYVWHRGGARRRRLRSLVFARRADGGGGGG